MSQEPKCAISVPRIPNRCIEGPPRILEKKIRKSEARVWQDRVLT